MVGDCRNWDEDAYRDSILQEREANSQTVFRTAFPSSLNPNRNPDLIVAASSDGTVASYSLSSILPSLTPGIGNARAQNLLVAEPSCLLQAHDGPAYDVKFYGADENSLLLSCGDDGRIRGWRWREMLDEDVHMSGQGSHLKPVLDLVNPQHKGPWGALSAIPETNAVAVNYQGGSIYSAAGDSCAYCWDVIITGSEDGTARIWDCKSGKCIRVIEPGKEKKSKGFFPYISCIALDTSESWLACGSGHSLSVWNLPACELVSEISTGASIQDVLFDDNQILAVGAEPLLSRFSMNDIVVSQIHTIPESAFSVSLHSSGVTAVAGYGGVVDVISQFGSHFCTFCCKARK